VGELAQQPQAGCSSSARSCVEPSPSCADLRLNQRRRRSRRSSETESRRHPKFLVAPLPDPPSRRARTETGTPRLEGRSVRDRTREAAGPRSRCLEPDRQPLNTGWSALSSSFASRVDVVVLGLAVADPTRCGLHRASRCGHGRGLLRRGRCRPPSGVSRHVAPLNRLPMRARIQLRYAASRATLRR
jgi:hypothetical protein